MKTKISIILACTALLLGFGLTANALEKIGGLNFSPYTGSQDPSKGDVVEMDQIVQRLTIVAPYTQWIRSFSCSGGLENIGPAARNLALKVAAGAWLSKDKSRNELEIESLIAICRQGNADLAIIGSETLYRQDFSGAELIGYINRFRQAAPGIPVAIADTYNALAENPDAVYASDVVLLNIYPYWEGIAISKAIAHMHNSYQGLKEQFPDKILMIGETGWPSAGNTIGNAKPSLINAFYYFWAVTSWSKAEDVRVFYFEAFDEPWKALYEGPQGSNWGVWNKSGIMKPFMRLVFTGISLPNHWSSNPIPGGNGKPEIIFTYIPSKGSIENLKGKIQHILPENYAVAVYIYVAGWWIKPYSDQPLIKIQYDGTWTCDITTGGDDINATKISAFVIPLGYTPPNLTGSATLSTELYEKSIATVEVTR